jgi:hypothetical protein
MPSGIWSPQRRASYEATVCTKVRAKENPEWRAEMDQLRLKLVDDQTVDVFRQMTKMLQEKHASDICRFRQL